VGSVPISQGGPATGDAYLVAVGEGAVWASNPAENAVYRVDPTTMKVTPRVPVGPDPWGVAVGAGHVWVAIHHGTDHGALERIDPRTNRVDGHVPLGPPHQGPGHVTTTGDAVWVAVDGDNVVARVDPTTLKVTSRIPVKGACGGITAVGHAIWISGRICGSGVTRVDTAKRVAGHTVRLEGLTLGVAADADSVWVASALGSDSATPSRLDAVSEKVLDRLAFDHGLAGVALGFGSVWTAGGDQVVRVTPR
jgi:YVTN family beta-propeller protein